MAFVEIYKTKFRVNGLTTKPMMSVIVNRHGDQHIYIRLPNELVHTTWGDKLFNDRRSVRLGILEGTESDAGSFMLVHNPRGYTFTASALSKADDTPSGSSFVTKMNMTVFKNYVPNVTPQIPTEMEYSVDGQAMLLLTPSWFVYTPKVAVRSTMVPVEKAAQGRPSAGITNQQRRLVR
jgi:hypothetical protein